MRALLIFLLALVPACSFPQPHPQTRSASVADVKSEAFWSSRAPSTSSEDLASKLLSRAPDEVIQYLAQQNRKDGIPTEPQAVVLDETLKSDILQAWAGLPENIRKIGGENLAALMVVKGVGSAGYTEIVLDSDRHGKKAFIILDAEQVDQKANEWFTSKERSPFYGLGYFNIEGKIAEKKDNTRIATLQFVLLHELGHVISVGSSYTPSWSEDEQRKIQHNSFAKLSWYVSGNDVKESIYDEKVFKQRTTLSFYGKGQGKNRIRASQILKTYKALERTNFISLYGATSVHDDFAESFAIYVHQRIMKKPYRIAIKKGKIVQKYFTPCWERPRCLDKLNVLEHFLRERSKALELSRLASTRGSLPL